jgi:hypothetical protein
MNLREALFRDWPGCTDGGCVVRDNTKGMHTNGGCRCVVNANRANLTILQSRINHLLNAHDPELVPYVQEPLNALREVLAYLDELEVDLGIVTALAKAALAKWEGK